MDNIENNISNIFNETKNYFNSNETKSLDFRLSQLKKLYKAIKDNEKEIAEALHEDLGKSYQEAYMCEIGLVYQEISYMIKHLKKWSKPKNKFAGLTAFPSKARVYHEPVGKVLIMSPWNYPFLLTVQPLVGAIGGGNVAIIRPSSQAKATAKIIEKITSSTFPKNYVYTFLGSREEADLLLEMPFDLIFFTGSPNIGKMVMAKASKNLTPVVLELGGKSPCIITKNADLDIAAKRLVFGKTINAGQTCVAPDYVLIDESLKDEFIKKMKKQISLQFPNGMIESNEYPKIISSSKKERLVKLIEQEKVILGGKSNDTKIELTLTDSTFDSEVMKDEIFGPILPIITYRSLEDTVQYLKTLATPLALYLYSFNKKEIEYVMSNLSFGGGAINDCLMHLSSHALCFGGKGNSGMGQYHGKYSFDTFTHKKGVLISSKGDMKVKYHPYSKKGLNFIKKVLK